MFNKCYFILSFRHPTKYVILRCALKIIKKLNSCSSIGKNVIAQQNGKISLK